MKIVVLMSSFNGESYIRAQIDSILSQKGDFQLDLRVRDDGSSDSTQSILEEYTAAGKLQWYTGENLGPAKSFFNLLQQYPGYDFYAFSDQDDYWYPDKLSRGLIALGSQTCPALYASNAQLVDQNMIPIGRNTHRQAPHYDFYTLVCAASVLGCTCIFNRQLAEAIQAHALPDRLIMHDYYLAVVCSFLGGAVLYDPEPSMDYRQHDENVVGTQWTKIAALKNRIHRITKPAKNSIASQASSILELYGSQASDREKLCFLQKVSAYRKNIFTALELACSRKPNYNSKNMSITMRLAILLRNR